jgi:hypothetical protein
MVGVLALSLAAAGVLGTSVVASARGKKHSTSGSSVTTTTSSPTTTTLTTTTPTTSSPATTTAPATVSSAPPPAGGYFSLVAPGKFASLRSGQQCASKVRLSSWEPRPDNTKRNHSTPDPAAVRASFAARPYDSSWKNWNTLLQRVDGQYAGTTDEIFQWAACKWGLADDLLRAVAVQESTWYQYETYPSGRCVLHFSCGDMVTSSTPDTVTYCKAIAEFGYDYQRDYGPGICPETFGLMGIKDWEDPSWGQMADNQNGAFPFNRNSTAFAVDYYGAYLRGCDEGWITWLSTTPGDIWGCVGAWFSGDWHTSAASDYASQVKNWESTRPWLAADWASDKPGCSSTYGCPQRDTLAP